MDDNYRVPVPWGQRTLAGVRRFSHRHHFPRPRRKTTLIQYDSLGWWQVDKHGTRRRRVYFAGVDDVFEQGYTEVFPKAMQMAPGF